MGVRQLAWSDIQIVKSLKNPAEHRKVFGELYRQLFPAVRMHVKQQGGSEQDAEDVFQEGILALWKNVQAGRYEVRANAKLSTYLIEICKRRWIDMQKKASRRYETRPEELPQISEGNFLEEWIGEEERTAFHQTFMRLGEKCREILTLFYYEKCSLRELAARRGVGEASMKNEKYRCMQRLRGLFA